MPTFPNGTRVWVSSLDGKQFPELAEKVTEDEEDQKHIREVFIPVTENQEFRIYIHPELDEGEEYSDLQIFVDGQLAECFNISKEECGKEHDFKGWQTGPRTLKRFAFGKIEVDEDADRPGAEDSKDLLSSCIEVRLEGSELDGSACEGCQLVANPIIADAVHPDSKAASLLGLQVKPGKSERCAAPAIASENLKTLDDSTIYIARFFYRAAGFLMAHGIMPDLNAVADKRGAGASNAGAAGAKEEPDAAKDEPAEAPAPGVVRPRSLSIIDVDAAPKKQRIFLDLTQSA